MSTLDAFNKLISNVPLPLLGAGAGGVVGALGSDENARLRGALQGAALGAGAGALGSTVNTSADRLGEALRRIPHAIKDVVGPSVIGGGALAGLMGASEASPYEIEKLRLAAEEKAERERRVLQLLQELETKETNMSTPEEKKAEEKQAVERAEKMLAFEFGIDTALDNMGLDKEATAKACGVSVSELPEALLSWRMQSEEEAKK
jgi:hypothetical protein